MRHLQAGAVRYLENPAGQKPQAFHTGSLVAALKQELKPQADSQKGRSLLRHPADHLHQIILAELFHGIPEGTHARQDHFVRCQNLLRAAGDHRRFSQRRQRLFHAAQVACIVIDNRYHGHLPLCPVFSYFNTLTQRCPRKPVKSVGSRGKQGRIHRTAASAARPETQSTESIATRPARSPTSPGSWLRVLWTRSR